MIGRVVRKLRHVAGRGRRALTRPAAAMAAVLIVAPRVATNVLSELLNARRSSRIRVGVDIRPFYEPLTGVGWYLYSLLEKLASDPRLELVAFGESAQFDGGPTLRVALPPGVRVVAFDFRASRWGRMADRATRLAFPLLAWATRCDLFFGANFFLPRPLSAVARKRVVTVHDLTYRRYPELLQKETLENLQRSMLREVGLADAIICVSEATRRDLLEFYDVAPHRAVTILSGLNTTSEERAPFEALPSRFILFVSTIEPRKNVDTLIGAFEDAAAQGGYDGDLVLVGKIGWKSEATVERIRRSRWRERIHHLDYLDRAALETAYARAEMFVFPSLYEGFGFPLLEAMAHGVPSISARTSSLPEVGGDAVLYFEPRDREALTREIVRLASSPALRSELGDRGKSQAARFQWANTARETADLFIRVAEEGR